MTMETGAVDAAVAELVRPACRHHWIIEPANGRVSWGECRNCHEMREFVNSVSEPDRDIDED